MGFVSATIPIQIHPEDMEAQLLEPQELVVSFCTGTTAILHLTRPPAWLFCVDCSKVWLIKETVQKPSSTFFRKKKFFTRTSALLRCLQRKMLLEIWIYLPQQQWAQAFVSGTDHRNHKNAPGFRELHIRSSKAQLLRKDYLPPVCCPEENKNYTHKHTHICIISILCIVSISLLYQRSSNRAMTSKSLILFPLTSNICNLPFGFQEILKLLLRAGIMFSC